VASSGTVPLQDVWDMLGACAPGHTKKATKHNWVVYYNGLTYHRLPLGEHGSRNNPGIQIGHVKSMARHLGILECAKQHIERLR
jgi:hypothetical protein